MPVVTISHIGIVEIERGQMTLALGQFTTAYQSSWQSRKPLLREGQQPGKHLEQRLTPGLQSCLGALPQRIRR